jgi:molecular chaperone DnaK (HSP70)
MEASPAAIGIDIGSMESILGAVRKGTIEIINSDFSNKQTPTVVAYTDDERLIGESAINQLNKNFRNTFQFFTRFIGLNA